MSHSSQFPRWLGVSRLENKLKIAAEGTISPPSSVRFARNGPFKGTYQTEEGHLDPIVAGPSKGTYQAEEGHLTYILDLTYQAEEGHLDPIVAGIDMVPRAIGILSRGKKNPFLIGGTMLDHRAVAEGIALAIVCGAAPRLAGKKVIEIDAQRLVSKTKSLEALKGTLDMILNDNNIIIFMNDAHHMVNQLPEIVIDDIHSNDSHHIMNKPEIVIDDVHSFFRHAVLQQHLQIIGASDQTDQLKSRISADKALKSKLQLVEVSSDNPSLVTVAEHRMSKNGLLNFHLSSNH